MRSRDVVGKRIARVVQERHRTNSGAPYYSVIGFDFADGTRLRFVVIEDEDEYGIKGLFVKPTLKEEGENDG